MIDLIGDRNIGDLLDEAVTRCGDKTWLIFESRAGSTMSLTYREFHRQVDRFASGLQSIGLAQGDIVILHMRNHPSFLIAWFALGIIGAISVPVNVDNTETELAFVLDHSRALMVIADAEYIDKYQRLRTQCTGLKTIVTTADAEPDGSVVAFADIATAGAPGCKQAVVRSGDIMQMLFTSGTTAAPKAAGLTHANCLHAGERIVKGLALQSDDCCLTALPLFHVNAQVMAVLSSMTAKATCVLLENFSARNYWHQVRRYAVTCTSLVAMQIRTILAQPAAPDERDHKIRRMSFFINVTDEEKIAFENRFGVTFINGYGLTEAMGVVTLSPVFGDQRWPSIGLPTADRVVRLIDDDGHDVAPGEVGEIIVRGDPGRTVMKGYFRDVEATERTLRDGWLHTGDKARTDEKGYIYFVDRKANLIKRAGENVSAMEVELVLLAHPGVLEAAVIAIPDAIRDERIKAVIAMKPAATFDPEEIRRFCGERLAAFKIPSEWEVVERLPRTPIKGDVDKKALRRGTSA